jgi:purine catabolism regulator
MNGLRTPAPLTVAAALRETPLRQATVAGGASGLERRITSVAVLDVADFDAVRPNQLALVSAYALLEADLAPLVTGLADREASGLGVKLDPYWSTMPDALVRAADSAGLPLLALPTGRFEDLVNPLLSAIVDRQAAVLRTTAVLHRELTEAALRDEGAGSAAEIVSDALGLQVAIFDEDGELLAAAGPGEDWSDRLADAATAVASAGPLAHGGETYLVAPISAMGQRYGTVCARGAAADDAIARAAIVEAAVVTGMQLLCRRHVENVHRQFEQDLLDDLVAGRLTEREARERGERVGWPVRRPYLVLLAARRPPRPGGRGASVDGGLGHDEQATLTRALRGQQFPVRSFPHRGCLACVVHFTRGEDAASVAEAVAGQLARARGMIWAPDELVVAASAPARDIAHLPDAVREASLTLTMSSALRRHGSRVAHFEGLGPARLLAQSRNRERLEAVARKELGGLAETDAPEVSDLLETLAVLLANNMRIVPAARELFFHYNTVRHRLARLRELFGDRLDTSDGQLSLWLSLVALRVAELDADRCRGTQLAAQH